MAHFGTCSCFLWRPLLEDNSTPPPPPPPPPPRLSGRLAVAEAGPRRAGPGRAGPGGGLQPCTRRRALGGLNKGRCARGWRRSGDPRIVGRAGAGVAVAGRPGTGRLSSAWRRTVAAAAAVAASQRAAVSRPRCLRGWRCVREHSCLGGACSERQVLSLALHLQRCRDRLVCYVALINCFEKALRCNTFIAASCAARSIAQSKITPMWSSAPGL